MKERNLILIIDLARLGDLTLTSPVIANLRTNHPIAHIAFLVSRESLPTVRNNPKLNEVFIYDKPAGNFFARIKQLWKISRLIGKGKFQTAFILHRSFTSALIAILSCIPERIGLATQGRSLLLTRKIPLDKNLHRLDNNLKILEAAGEEIRFSKPEYYPDPTQSEVVKEAKEFKNGNKLVIINPNGVWETKRWFIDRFAQVANRLSEKDGVRVIIVGGKGDEERGIKSRGTNKNILDLTGKTSIDDLYNIMKISDLVITNDSGPMHIAACAGSNIIAIFGPTDPRRCGPRSQNPVVLYGDVNCLKCYKKNCETMKCMENLPVEKVLDEAEKIL